MRSQSQLDKHNGMKGETSNEVTVMGIKAIWSGKTNVAPDNTECANDQNKATVFIWRERLTFID